MFKRQYKILFRLGAVALLAMMSLSFVGCIIVRDSDREPHVPSPIAIDDYYGRYSLTVPSELYSEGLVQDILSDFADLEMSFTDVNTVFLNSTNLEADDVIYAFEAMDNVSVASIVVNDNISNLLISVDDGTAKQVFCYYLQDAVALYISELIEPRYVMSVAAGYIDVGYRSFLFPVQYAYDRQPIDNGRLDRVQYKLMSTIDEFVAFYTEYGEDDYEYDESAKTMHYTVGKNTIGAKYYIDMKLDEQQDGTLVATCIMQ